MAHGKLMFTVSVVIALPLSAVGSLANWSDQTLMAAALLGLFPLAFAYMAAEFREDRRRRARSARLAGRPRS